MCDFIVIKKFNTNDVIDHLWVTQKRKIYKDWFLKIIMIKKDLIGYTIIVMLFTSAFLNSRYEQLNNNMPKNETVIDTNKVKIEKDISPKLLWKILPTAKPSLSYLITYSPDFRDRKGSIYTYEFKTNVSNLSKYNLDNIKLSPVNKASDTCYRLMKGTSRDVTKEFKINLEQIIGSLNKSQN